MSEQCPKISAIGTPCDLEEGHDGPHSVTYPDLPTRTWTDEGDRRFMDSQKGLGLGT